MFHMSKDTKILLLIFSLILILASLLFMPLFIGKVNLNGEFLVTFYEFYGRNLPFKDNGADQLRIYFPFYKITFEQFRNFSIPLWNPYAFSGHPHLADFQTAVFYPFNIFGLFLSQIEFWHLLRISSLVFAAFFTYLFLRILNLSKLASIFGAITFGFSPFIITWGNEVIMSPHSIIWLPLILLAIEKYQNKSNKIYLAIIAFSSMFTLFAGYMQTTIYLFIFTFAYLIFRIKINKLFSKKSILLFGATLFGGFLSAIQLIPSGELFFNSARSQIALTEKLIGFLVPVEGLLTYLAPDIFGNPATRNLFKHGVSQYYESIMFVGIAALMFGTFALFLKKKDFLKINIPGGKKYVIFLTVVGLVSLSTVLDLPTSKLFLSIPIPFLSSSITNRILFIPVFCISILAAIGMQAYLNGNKKIIKIVIGFAILYAVIFINLFSSKYLNLGFGHGHEGIFKPIADINISLRNLVIPLAVFLLSSSFIVIGNRFRNLKQLLAIFIIAIAFLHIMRFNYKYLPFSDRSVIFPENPIISYIQKNQDYHRSWVSGMNVFENNFASQYSIYWPEGFDSLNNIRYAQFTDSIQRGNFLEFVPRADAGLGRSSTQELLSNPMRRKLIDLIGIKYVMANSNDTEELEKHNFVKILEIASADTRQKNALYENTYVHSRTQLISNYEVLSGDQAIMDKLLSEEFNYKNSIVLEEKPSINPEKGEGESKIVSYEPNEVIVSTESKVPKILLLSDNYYPGWKAKVDGVETKVLRANFTFRSIPLEAGKHTVIFYFDSLSFKLGAIITLFSLLTAISLYFKKNSIVG